MIVMQGRIKAEELLRLEEADAWFEYREALSDLMEPYYSEAEAWAWANLQQKLRAVEMRRDGMKAA
jgi:hypothetical protein